MKDEYIIINKTKFLKIKEELEKGSPHWDGIYISDYQMGQIDLIEKIITSQSTPLIPEIEKAFDEGKSAGIISYQPIWSTLDIELYNEIKQEYISNLKLDI